MNFRAAAKFILVGLLALLLFVPVLMIRNLVFERQQTRNEVVHGIAEGWGKRQVVSGPFLAMPYERHWTEVRRETVDGKLREIRIERSESNVLRVLPASVDWSGDADIGEKARGIYTARLYTVKLHAQGAIDVPARTSHEDGTSRYKWGTPRLVVGVSDPLGIRAASGSHPFEPGASSTGSGLQSLLRAHDLSKPGKVEFSIDLELAGSEAFSVAPLGADATIALRANWPHPSFQGRFLPTSHDIRADGFTARWKISRLASQGIGDAGASVWFIEPVSLYQQLERASKYGFLFIGLTFAAFLVFELLRRLAIHPVQYTLVGLALAMFFLLLTALSEHVDFAVAYAAASAACVGLITTYLVWVLKSARIALAFGAARGALYAMLYALLKAEDYSLLGGALLLFGLLAAVMLATRRVEWYQLVKTGA